MAAIQTLDGSLPGIGAFWKLLNCEMPGSSAGALDADIPQLLGLLRVAGSNLGKVSKGKRKHSSVPSWCISFLILIYDGIYSLRLSERQVALAN